MELVQWLAWQWYCNIRWSQISTWFFYSKLLRSVLCPSADSDLIFIRISGGRILLKRDKSIQTCHCHEGLSIIDYYLIGVLLKSGAWC